MNKNEVEIITKENLEGKIHYIRGQKVMLDRDLAEIYGYETKKFNQQVQRNIEKFEEDFMFQLTEKEMESLRSKFLTAKTVHFEGKLRCQIGTAKSDDSGEYNLRSQIVTANISSMSRSLPYAFTEQGIYMLMTAFRILIFFTKFTYNRLNLHSRGFI